jgi:hypothetical protein
MGCFGSKEVEEAPPKPQIGRDAPTQQSRETPGHFKTQVDMHEQPRSYTRIHSYQHAYRHTCTSHAHVTYVYTHAHAHTHTHTYTHIHTHTYTHTHTRTHTHTPMRRMRPLRHNRPLTQTHTHAHLITLAHTHVNTLDSKHSLKRDTRGGTPRYTTLLWIPGGGIARPLDQNQ